MLVYARLNFHPAVPPIHNKPPTVLLIPATSRCQSQILISPILYPQNQHRQPSLRSPSPMQGIELDLKSDISQPLRIRMPNRAPKLLILIYIFFLIIYFFFLVLDQQNN